MSNQSMARGTDYRSVGNVIGTGFLSVSVNSKGATWLVPCEVIDVQHSYGLVRFLVRQTGNDREYAVLVDASRVALTSAGEMLRRLAGVSVRMPSAPSPEREPRLCACCGKDLDAVPSGSRHVVTKTAGGSHVCWIASA